MHTGIGGAAGRILRQSATISALIALGVVVGLAVDVLIVARYGVGATTDAFFAGYTVPFILVTRLAAVQPVLVSVLAGCRRGDTGFSALLNASVLLALLVAASGAALARPIVALTAPGFSPSTAALAVRVATILFARVPFAAASEVFRAELHVRRHFGLATFGNVLPGLVTACILLLFDGTAGIETVAWGMVTGAGVQAALLAVVLFGMLHAPYRLALRHDTPVLRDAGRMIVAPLAGLLVREGVTLTERVLGSFLATGSVTALSYAGRMNAVFAGVFFDGVTTTRLPRLAELWHGNREAGKAHLVTLLKLATLVALPAGLAVAALSTPLARLFFQRGQVDPAAALLLGTVFGIYSLSLPALGPFRVVHTFFYATRDVWPVAWLHAGLAALTILLDLLLVGPLGAAGLAFAYASSCGIMCLVALALVRRRVGGGGWRSLASRSWRLAVASLTMAGTMFAVSRALGAADPAGSRWELLLSLLAGAGAGVVLLGIVGTALRIETITLAGRMIKDRWAIRTRIGS